MRRFLLILGLSLGLNSVAIAQDNPIEEVISTQIEAFRADDFETAFTFASPTIQNLFQTPEKFGDMVRQGYPMVWRPAEVMFFEQKPRGGGVWQRLQITDQSGASHWFAYEMVQIEGAWRINGVFRLQDEKPNV